MTPKGLNRARFRVHSHGRSPQGRRFRRAINNSVRLIRTPFSAAFCKELGQKMVEWYWLKKNANAVVVTP